MLSNVWWNAIDSLYPYADYLTLATLVVVFFASAGILLLFRRTKRERKSRQETRLRDWMVQMTANFKPVLVLRALGWACFALALAVMIYPSWYCEYKPRGTSAFVGDEPVRRSAVWSPPVCQREWGHGRMALPCVFGLGGAHSLCTLVTHDEICFDLCPA